MSRKIVQNSQTVVKFSLVDFSSNQGAWRRVPVSSALLTLQVLRLIGGDSSSMRSEQSDSFRVRALKLNIICWFFETFNLYTVCVFLLAK